MSGRDPLAGSIPCSTSRQARRSSAPTAVESRSHALGEIVGPERLGEQQDVGRGPRDLRPFQTSAHHDRGETRLECAHREQRLDPAEARHGEIEQGDVDSAAVGLELRHRFHAVGSLDHAVAALLERKAQEASHGVLVVGEQDDLAADELHRESLRTRLCAAGASPHPWVGSAVVKAVLIDRPGDESAMRIGSAPEPALGAGELRIRVAATAVNRADLLQRQGLYPPPPGASPILGLECAGEVIELGPGVAGWRVGERAMALLSGGGYAEQAVVDAGSALRVPASLSIEEAAAVPEVFLTAYLNLFELGALPARGSALVHGGGSGVGTAAIQLVRAAGGRVIVTAGSDEKCARCRELGADLAVNYRSDSFAERVREATDGRGVDVVLDSIGAPYLAANLDSLALGGRLVLIGLMGGAKVELNLAVLLGKRLSVIGSTLRARPIAEKAEIAAAFWRRFGDDLVARRIRPIVDRVLPIEAVANAHRAVKASDHFGKIVLRLD